MAFNEVIAYVGPRGACKTLFAVATMKSFQEEGSNIFTNITLKGIPYRKVTFKEIADFPDWLRDGLVVMDEMTIGADAYNFLHKQVRDITKFVVQIRKRNIMFIMITQDFSTIAKRLRGQTDYFYQFKALSIGGTAMIDVFDLRNNFQFVQKIPFDGREYFKFYDTNEIIS
jgi:hypothetical protein